MKKLFTICLVASAFLYGLTTLAQSSQYTVPIDWSAYENDKRVFEGAKAFRKKKYKKADKLFRKAAADGNPVAYLNLATVLDNLYYKNRDTNEARKWLKKAADTGYPQAQYRFADELYDFDGSKTNKEGIILYIKAAEAGLGDAQSALGSIYENGNDVKRDYKKSAYWFLKAAANGHYYAQKQLDSFYSKGLVKKSETTAQAAGIVSSHDVGAYLGRLKVRQNPSEPREARVHYSTAMEHLGLHHLQDRQQAYQDAAKWLGKSGELGYVPAQVMLANWFLESDKIVRSYPQAAYWFKKAAENGNAEARASLEFLLLTGLVPMNEIPGHAVNAGHKRTPEESFFAGLEAGYKKDFTRSEALLTEAAQEGHMDAQAALARMYYEGEGVPRSLKLAYRWYREAGNQGHIQSQYMMGYMWHHGEARSGAPSAGDFVSDTILEARKWYEKAAAYGHQDARRQLQAIANYTPPPPPPMPKPGWFERFAIDAYQRAQDTNNRSRPLSTRTSGGNPVYQAERCYQVSDKLKQCFRD